MATASEPIIGVHLDLKGAMFRPPYIPTLLADLAGQRVNAVLVEYEDVFPFDAGRGVDVAWDRSAAWSKRTLHAFLAEADRQGIEVIPLQQCLGHLEYVFRWKRYRRFAENVKYPSTLALANPKGKALVFEMLRQVAEAHPGSRFLHLGMDEAHALVTAAQAKGQDVLDAFLDYLRELCDLAESYGKTPVIWSDMLEDHFKPGVFADLKDRVVLMPWDYAATTDRIAVGRIAGWRTSKAWHDEPEHADAPAIAASHTYIEDLPDEVRKLVGRNLQGRYFTSMFQADLWTKLGFRVIGASAIRSSAHLATMPFYHRLMGNIGQWSKAIRRTRQAGQIATSWARGTTFGPVNYTLELTWPLIAELSRTMGADPPAFFPGVPEETVRRLVLTLGRSRGDWRLEGRVAAEMEELSPKVRAHRYEWDSIALMARVLELQRRAEFNIAEVDHFHSGYRPPEPEWQRRLTEQAGTLKEIAAMQKRLRAHFGKRYHGEAFEEWLRDLFDLLVRRVKESQTISRAKLAKARKLYAI